MIACNDTDFDVNTTEIGIICIYLLCIRFYEEDTALVHAIAIMERFQSRRIERECSHPASTHLVPKTSSRRFQDVQNINSEDVHKTLNYTTWGQRAKSSCHTATSRR